MKLLDYTSSFINVKSLKESNARWIILFLTILSGYGLHYTASIT